METRNYNSPDVDMMDTGRTHRGHFNTYKSDFIGFDPMFNDPYYDDWGLSIEASEGWEDAETRDDQLKQETADVKGVMRVTHECYIGMKRFIEKAFSGKPDIMNKFGLDGYTEASGSQKEMKKFLTNLHRLSNTTFNAELLAVNCPQSRIDQILTIKNTLVAEDTQQNVFRTSEPVDTNARVKQYNSTFKFDREVNHTSKVIFYNDPEKLNLFLFPRHSEPVEVFNVLGKASDSVTAAALSGVQVKISTTPASPGITTTTDLNGEYGFAAIAPGNYSLEFSKPGYMTQVFPITVLASGAVTQNALLVPGP